MTRATTSSGWSGRSGSACSPAPHPCHLGCHGRCVRAPRWGDGGETVSNQMTKRLHVLFNDDEFGEIQREAERRRQTAADVVRDALRDHLRSAGGHTDGEPRLRAVREARAYDYPVGDVRPERRDRAWVSRRGKRPRAWDRPPSVLTRQLRPSLGWRS